MNHTPEAKVITSNLETAKRILTQLMVLWMKCSTAQKCPVHELIHTHIYLVLTYVPGTVLGGAGSKMKNSSDSALRARSPPEKTALAEVLERRAGKLWEYRPCPC